MTTTTNKRSADDARSGGARLRSKLGRRTFIVAACAFGAGVLPGIATAQWTPNKDVEIVVTVGPGTAPDQMAREFQALWRQAGLVKANVSVVNKPGGGGAVGLAYLNNANAGSPHHLAIAGASMVSNNLAGRSPIGCADVTPVAHVLAEYIGIAVHPDSPLKTGKDLLDKLKENPQSVSIGIATSRGNSNHQAIAVAAKKHGVDVKRMKTVIFQAGSEARTAVLGKHIDVVPASVGSLAKQVEAGQLRLLAVTSPERLGGAVANVPTWREQGVDAVVSNWRGVIGPKNMPAEAVAYWQDVLQKTVENPEFKKSAEAAYQSIVLLKGQEFAKYCAVEKADIASVLEDMGM
jgi:putative tricarboxylic transport membrane protein